MNRIKATYLVRSTAAAISARADGIRVEQSVEMPLAGVRDAWVMEHIVGRVESITPAGPAHPDCFKVIIGLAAESARPGIAQLMNMLFGNTSLHQDVELLDAELPDELLAEFPGPRHGVAGLRRLTGATAAPITCTALKPQGLSVAALADLTYRLALSGLHIIKDDHGIANQDYSPFAERLIACQAAVARANRETGGNTLYAPTLSGAPSQLFAQARLVREAGVQVILVSPMVIGLPAFQELVADHLDAAVLAHPAMGGAAKISPVLLFGKLFRLLGADAVIFTGYGGRFAYSRELCVDIAETARGPLGHCKPAMPVPAGGMRVDRVDELVNCYGGDTMLLIGGDLLIAGDALVERGREFVSKVASAHAAYMAHAACSAHATITV